jgi:nucleotide-binding universal stress UspA family protein
MLLATDGLATSDPAAAFAGALAARDGARLEVLTILDLSRARGEPGAAAAGSDVDLQLALADRVSQQLRRATALRPAHPVRLELGRPPEVITRVAESCGAELIVLGLRPHPAADRLLGRETTLQVMHQAPVPVIAVPPDCRGLPRRAMVAVDFSPASVAAARLALGLLGGRGALYLVHVRAPVPISLGGVPTGWNEFDDPGVDERLAALRDALAPPEDVHVELATLRGAPAPALLQFASEQAIDLIATGARGHGALARVLLGSVSTDVVRGATCSVLVAPPAAAGG